MDQSCDEDRCVHRSPSLHLMCYRGHVDVCVCVCVSLWLSLVSKVSHSGN